MVNDTLDQLENRNLLPKKNVEVLKLIYPLTSKFYVRFKIHKGYNPRKSVINSMNRHISEISRFAYHHLPPKVKKILSDIKNINDFLNKINNFKAQKNSLLATTMDVKAFHTKIPNKAGIAAVKRKHEKYTK